MKILAKIILDYPILKNHLIQKINESEELQPNSYYFLVLGVYKTKSVDLEIKSSNSYLGIQKIFRKYAEDYNSIQGEDYENSYGTAIEDFKRFIVEELPYTYLILGPDKIINSKNEESFDEFIEEIIDLV